MNETFSDEVTVKEPVSSDSAVLITSEMDVDCVLLKKSHIPILIEKLQEYNKE